MVKVRLQLQKQSLQPRVYSVKVVGLGLGNCKLVYTCRLGLWLSLGDSVGSTTELGIQDFVNVWHWLCSNCCWTCVVQLLWRFSLCKNNNNFSGLSHISIILVSHVYSLTNNLIQVSFSFSSCLMNREELW